MGRAEAADILGYSCSRRGSGRCGRDVQRAQCPSLPPAGVIRHMQTHFFFSLGSAKVHFSSADSGKNLDVIPSTTALGQQPSLTAAGVIGRLEAHL